jgi:hypothetical protein
MAAGQLSNFRRLKWTTMMTTTLHGDSVTRRGREHRLSRRILIGLQLFTGISAVIGGILLVVSPDGSLLRADPAVLAGTPFVDWRGPGTLLAALVGGGFLVAAFWQRPPLALYISVLAGAGLVAFEAVEFTVIGPQPLEAVFAFVGLLVVILAIRVHRVGRATK